MPLPQPPSTPSVIQHPGAIVRQRIPASMSVTEAAKRLGVSRQQLHALIDGRASVSPRMALRLQAAFGPPAETWLVMQLHYDVSRARKSPPRGIKSIG